MIKLELYYFYIQIFIVSYYFKLIIYTHLTTIQYLIDTIFLSYMNQIDHRFSSLGLLTYKFQLKFKKVLLFLQTMDDPELLFYMSSFLDIQDLLSLLSTCKKLNSLKYTPVIQVRILRQKIRFLQSPKQAFNSLSLLPSYYQYLSHQKQDQKQIPKNASLFFKNFKQYMEVLKKRKQLPLKHQSQVTKLLAEDKKNQSIISNMEKQIQEQSQIYRPTLLPKEPQAISLKNKSYVQKFRQEYTKMKQFERKKNIQQLQLLHKNQSEKVRIVKQIETPFKTIPIIQIRNDQKINVVKADSFYINKVSKIMNRFRTILGLNIYY